VRESPSTLINNLLFYRDSVLATDPKAEFANVTAARRAALGQKVHVLDPFGNTSPRTAHLCKSYNPLAILKADSPTIIDGRTCSAHRAGKGPALG